MNNTNNTEEQINSIIENNKLALIILSGEDCKWCKKLKEHLKDGTLEHYCNINNIKLETITMASKAEEEKDCQEHGVCKITTRNRFGIKTIPTAILFKNKIEIAKTEYIDEVEIEGIGTQAYVNWISNILFPKKRILARA